VRWGERVAPRGTSTATLPHNDKSALELLAELHERKLRPRPPAVPPFS
jgi:hypothetical protein